MKTPHEKVLTIAMEENSFLFPTMWRRLPPEILARMIENEPKLAIYVDGLSIEMQHAIVKKNPHYALYLHAVSEEVQMEMVRGSPWQLFNVFPQCEAAQLYAVAQSSGFYRVLSNPSVKTRSYLLKHDPVFAAQWVTKLTLEEKLALIAADRRCLFFIEQLEDVLEFLLEVQVCRFGIAMAENTLSSLFWVSPPSDSQVDANVSCKNYDKVLWKQLRAELLAPRFCV